MQFLYKLGSLLDGSGGGWPARLGALAPTAAAAVLVVALAAQLALLALKLLVPPSDTTGLVDTGPVLPSGPNVAGIVNAHLFGNAAVEATGDAASAPATNLNLALAGTLAGGDPERGWAIIGDTAQTARVYATGASLPGGAKLKAVYADRVVLERNGRLESLPLPRLAGGAPVPIVYSQGLPQQSLADTVRTLVQQDPGAVSEIIRPQPVFAGGQQKGYRVYPGRNRAQFGRLGLMPGDLVTAVNGAPLDDPNRGLETLRGIGGGSPVTLTIERNGVEQQVTVDPASVAADMPSASDPQPVANPDDSE
jgi:general secretion pathway protein C